ncbi:MAG: NAD(P)H-dependent oxidoreductase [Asgard group archaeon]|nr:NAD(P)H-dependent oxidoreductase [Asgard group archaeon]
MKLLLIHASPRKNGNTTKISKILEDEFTKNTDVEFEWLFLRDYPLEECRGCHNCIIKGEDKCPLKDSREAIQNKMTAVEGVIMITPMYSFHVSTMMKTFIDHFAFLVHRPRFHKKKAMVVSIAGGPSKAPTNYMAQNARAWGFDIETKLNTIAHLDALRPSFEQKERKKIAKSCQKFYNAVKKGKIKKPSIYDIVFFKIWQLNSIAVKSSYQTDYEYWKEQGWYESKYYFPVRIGLIKRMISAFAFSIVKSMMHRVYKDY